jgi:hypothetical protein
MPNGSPIYIGKVNTGTDTTTLQGGGGEAFYVFNGEGAAIRGTATGIGVEGSSSGFIGVYGEATQGFAVWGSGAVGVLGAGVDEGVWGFAEKVAGVRGSSEAAAGVFGESATNGVVGTSSGPNGAGVLANRNTKGAGVWGFSTSGVWPGVEGYSFNGNGVRGVSMGSAFPKNVGVVGYSESGIGVYGATGAGGPWAGFFDGNLGVSGAKFAVVRHPDGSHRGLYALGSPECWFEDFGRTKLVRGKGKVRLDQDFAAVARTDDYHVFISPEGESRSLFVTRRTRNGFEVREGQRGKSNMSFSYRVVARRKDVTAERFPRFKHPDIDAKDLKRSLEPPEMPPPPRDPAQLLKGAKRRGGRSR